MNQLDDVFREGIKNDYLIFDNPVALEIHHANSDAAVDWEAGKVHSSLQVTLVENCLFRQPSLRSGPSVPEVHQRDIAIQKDSLSTIDTVIEIPILVDLIIKEDDTIVNPATGENWIVQAVDYSTLNTRYRLGCMRLR